MRKSSRIAPLLGGGRDVESVNGALDGAQEVHQGCGQLFEHKAGLGGSQMSLGGSFDSCAAAGYDADGERPAWKPAAGHETKDALEGSFNARPFTLSEEPSFFQHLGPSEARRGQQAMRRPGDGGQIFESEGTSFQAGNVGSNTDGSRGKLSLVDLTLPSIVSYWTNKKQNRPGNGQEGFQHAETGVKQQGEHPLADMHEHLGQGPPVRHGAKDALEGLSFGALSDSSIDGPDLFRHLGLGQPQACRGQPAMGRPGYRDQKFESEGTSFQTVGLAENPEDQQTKAEAAKKKRSTMKRVGDRLRAGGERLMAMRGAQAGSSTDGNHGRVDLSPPSGISKGTKKNRAGNAQQEFQRAKRPGWPPVRHGAQDALEGLSFDSMSDSSMDDLNFLHKPGPHEAAWGEAQPKTSSSSSKQPRSGWRAGGGKLMASAASMRLQSDHAAAQPGDAHFELAGVLPTDAYVDAGASGSAPRKVRGGKIFGITKPSWLASLGQGSSEPLQVVSFSGQDDIEGI